MDNDLRRQVRELLDPMLDQHNKGQERLRNMSQLYEQLEERVNVMEQALLEKGEGGGSTIFDKIRDKFTDIES
jgi:hypothetical protein